MWQWLTGGIYGLTVLLVAGALIAYGTYGPARRRHQDDDDDDSGGRRQNLMVKGQAQCVRHLAATGQMAQPPANSTVPWCNATWDSILCWPATPANASAVRRCPALRGLDTSRSVYKWCHESGRWATANGSAAGDEKPQGFTHYANYCLTSSISDIMVALGPKLEEAQKVAKIARKVEYVGLITSFVCLVISVIIFISFRRLHQMRIQLHLQLCLAILAVVVIRLILYADLAITEDVVALPESSRTSINTMPVLCEFFYFILEYFKTVAFAWMFMEGFYLHNRLAVSVFETEPKMTLYTLVGYVIPLVHCILWLAVVLWVRGANVERCFGHYYMNPEYWILDGIRMFELIVNTVFLLNVLRILWRQAGASRAGGAADEAIRMRKSVKAAFMLIPLLGIPNILQTIPFPPTSQNIEFFAVWTYCACFLYMFQGAFIAVLFCFTNKEVMSVLRQSYERYKLARTPANDLRRGSRGTVHRYNVSIRNGSIPADGAGGSERGGSIDSGRSLMMPAVGSPPPLCAKHAATVAPYKLSVPDAGQPAHPPEYQVLVPPTANTRTQYRQPTLSFEDDDSPPNGRSPVATNKRSAGVGAKVEPVKALSPLSELISMRNLDPDTSTNGHAHMAAEQPLLANSDCPPPSVHTSNGPVAANCTPR